MFFVFNIKEKRLRASTLLRSTALQRKQELEKQSLRHPIPLPNWRSSLKRMTQEELLEEAKQTEKINLRSLARFQESEVEQKKKRNRLFKRKGVDGPTIKYISTTMPVVKPESTDPEPMELGEENENDAPVRLSLPVQERCARTFIVFSDGNLFQKYFPSKSQPGRGGAGTRGSREYCVITGLPAKYKDPITGLPYATSDAFKKIRSAYEAFLAESQDPAAIEYLQWKKNNRQK